jgi:hypothetical protein
MRAFSGQGGGYVSNRFWVEKNLAPMRGIEPRYLGPFSPQPQQTCALIAMTTSLLMCSERTRTKWKVNKRRFLYNFQNSRLYSLFCLSSETRRFREWILSPSSCGTYLVGSNLGRNRLRICIILFSSSY